MGLDNPIHILILLVVLLLLFGAKRLPEMGRGLGAGMRDFKDALTGEAKHDASGETKAAELPAHTAPVQTAPAHTAPAHTAPAHTAPVQTAPAPETPQASPVATESGSESKLTSAA